MPANAINKKDKGGWLVHHAKKLQNIADPTDFENILMAGKAAQLLSALSASDEESSLSREEVRTLARNSQITRVELHTGIDGVSFGDAWPNRKLVTVDGLEIPCLGRDELIRNKKASGREKDLLDIKTLEGLSA